jgi:hypothetical protein
MIDIKIVDILQTICIGLFAITIALFFYFYLSKLFVKNKFDEEQFFKWIKELLTGNVQETGYLLLTIVLVYFLGVVAGDLTERMTDSNNDAERPWYLTKLNGLSKMPQIGHIRRLSLIDSNNELTNLGKSVFRSVELVREANQSNNTTYFMDSSLKQVYPDSTTMQAKKYITADSNFDGFITDLFYSCKNWCYSIDHEAKNELKSLQVRIDLNRSIALLSVIGLIFLIATLIVYFIVHIVYIKTPLKKYFKNDFNNFPLDAKRHTAIAFILLLGSFVLTKECYRINLFSFNKRAYGYYVSHLRHMDLEEKKRQQFKSETEVAKVRLEITPDHEPTK